MAKNFFKNFGASIIKPFSSNQKSASISAASMLALPAQARVVAGALSPNTGIKNPKMAKYEYTQSVKQSKPQIKQQQIDRAATSTNIPTTTQVQEQAPTNNLNSNITPPQDTAAYEQLLAEQDRMDKTGSALEQKAPEVPNVPEVPESPQDVPQTPTAPAISETQKQLDAIRQRIASTYSPTAEETALADELARVEGGYRQAIAGEEGQGRGRTYGLVVGRQGKLAEQGALETQTLAQRLANMQASRVAQQQGLAVEERALADQFAREEAQRQYQEQQARPFEFGGNLVRLNPLTGKLDIVAEGPKETIKPITLNEGQSLVNPFTGEVLLSMPKTSDPLQQQEQALRIQKLQQELGGDLSSGVLSQEQLSKLQQSPEFKAINAVDSFYTQLQNYTSLVEQFGTAGALQPGQRKALQSAYADLGTSWKELKKLGALTGPDLELLEQAIPNAGSPGMFGAFDPTQASRILNTLRNTEKQVSLDAVRQYHRLTLQNPSYAQSDYVTSYVLPFVQSDSITAEDVASAVNFPLDQVQQARNAGYDEATLKAFILTPSFSQDLGTSQNGLGTLSEKYESGGDPGAIGYDSTGGYSYGTYQLAHNNAQRFIEQSKYAQAFQGLKFNSPEFRARWQQLAKQDPQGFKEAQKQYIKQTHFDPQVDKLQSAGINVSKLNPVVLDAIWSTAVQHGPGTNIIVEALKKAGSDPVRQLQEIYKLRWSGGKNFASSTPQVRNSVYNRFFGPQGELNLALSRLS